MRLHYITDQRPGEPDILTPVKHSRLIIKSLEGNEIYNQKAPDGGWTHELLSKVQPEGMQDGANAYLENQWIGSTEI
ncbi:TPA: hypothetical protein J8G71_004956 [Escherichia coli]|nr:hypothetical protein [Escherichia coli]HAZ6359067.1 hypothetical protein [Escherichia coli]HAZ6439342.1 hypothetical protein [Escherichia coli]HAZ7593253.1 hypothetical protein [Escherichia coli]